jgi:hypothetical protein
MTARTLRVSHQTFALTVVKLGDFVCHAEADQTAQFVAC